MAARIQTRRASKPLEKSEIQQRANIVRRYVALASPSADDDNRFAEQLGLSVDSLLRLAASWRRHGRIDTLQGARAKPTEHDRALAIAVASGDLDMSRVSPTRRAETRRRIEIIRDYMLIEKPSIEDNDRAAEAAGMQRYRFNRMVKAWQIHRDPTAIPGSVTPARRPRRKNPTISQDAEQAIRDAILELGHDAAGASIYDLAVQLCAQRGVTPASAATTYLRIADARSGGGPPSHGIVLDHTALRLLVTLNGRLQLPVVSLAIQTPSLRILAFSTSLSPPTAQNADSLIDLLFGMERPDAQRLPLHLRAPRGGDWDTLLKRLASEGVEVETGYRRSLEPGQLTVRTLGPTLGALHLNQGLTTQPWKVPNRLLERMAAIAPEQANEMIEEAIAEHNLQTSRPSFRLTRS